MSADNTRHEHNEDLQLDRHGASDIEGLPSHILYMLDNNSDDIMKLCSCSKKLKSQCDQYAKSMLKKRGVLDTTHALRNLVATKSLLREFGIDYFHPSILNSVQPKVLLEEIQSISSEVVDTFSPIITKEHTSLHTQELSLSKLINTKIKERTRDIASQILPDLRNLYIAMDNRGHFNRNHVYHANKSDQEIENVVTEDQSVESPERIRAIMHARTKEFSDFNLYLIKKQKIFLNAARNSLSEAELKQALPIITAILCSTINKNAAKAMVVCFLVRIMKGSVYSKENKTFETR